MLCIGRWSQEEKKVKADMDGTFCGPLSLHGMQVIGKVGVLLPSGAKLRLCSHWCI